MKYLIFIITILSIIGCNPNSNTINPNPNPNGTNHDWWFEIKVDGVPHRIEGSFNSCDNNNNWDYKSGSNSSSVSTFNSTQIISVLNNKGESDYVSGENFHVSLFDVQNLNLGINDFSLSESSSLSESFIGVDCYSYYPTITSNGLNQFSLVPLDTSQYYNDKFPINITQYPTPHSFDNTSYCWNIGNPIIGSGSSTIYVLDTVDNSLPFYQRFSYRRPYNIEIDFKLYMNQ